MAGVSEPHRFHSAVIVVLGLAALPTARRIQSILPGAEIHGLGKRMTRADSPASMPPGVDHTFADLAAHLQKLYRGGRPIIGLCAAGILIRCLAECIGASVSGGANPASVSAAQAPADVADSPNTAEDAAFGVPRISKCIEPPVLAVAMDGSAVVPLLGGLAGVNSMARAIAAALDVDPAITTTGELRFGTCLLDPPEGYRLADIDVGKRFVSDLLAGETTRVDSTANVAWLDDIDLPKSADATLRIRISVEKATDAHTLLIHPRAIVVAFTPFGQPVASATSIPLLDADTIVERVHDALTRRGLAPLALSALVLDAKHIGDDAAQEAATRLNVPVRFVTANSTSSAGGTNSGTNNSNSSTSSTRSTSGTSDASSSSGSPGANDSDRSANRSTHAPDAQCLLETACSWLRKDLSFKPVGDHVETDATSSDTHVHTAPQNPQIALTILDAPLQPRELEMLGRKRGSLSVVGIGPGDKTLLAPAAQHALANADDILGYSTYTDMAGPYTARQVVHGTDNREEMQRARHAFTLASSGRDVVMVSSGDPGVFAMASAVMEALDECLGAIPYEYGSAHSTPHRTPPGGIETPVPEQTAHLLQSNPDTTRSQDIAAEWSSVNLRIIPGISAAMATAAVAGAPLGHDFCVLSLSDNLKPWAVIESRLRLAAQADLVIALYNPVSKARPWQLGRALEILRTERNQNCLVMLGRDIGRPGASLRTVPLHAVESDMVDMRTMLIVGSSTTRQFTTHDGKSWVYTPRWYPNDLNALTHAVSH